MFSSLETPSYTHHHTRTMPKDEKPLLEVGIVRCEIRGGSFVFENAGLVFWVKLLRCQGGSSSSAFSWRCSGWCCQCEGESIAEPGGSASGPWPASAWFGMSCGSIDSSRRQLLSLCNSIRASVSPFIGLRLFPFSPPKRPAATRSDLA